MSSNSTGLPSPAQSYFGVAASNDLGARSPRPTRSNTATTSNSNATLHRLTRPRLGTVVGNPSSRQNGMPSSYSSSPSASRTNTTYPLSSPTPTSQQSLQPLPAVVYVAAKPDDVDVGAIGRTSSTTDNNIITPESIKAGIDGLFVRFGVKDVRGIAVRGQEKAESKRDELRTMVGERYRDLLGAADSIVRMRKSSSKLLRKLERARDECDRESMAERALQEDLNRSRMVSRATTPLPSGHTPYGVATLVKLVIDCPEHVWRAIESQDYLTAARLEGLGRAVYRELGKRSRDGDEKRDEEEQEDDIEAAFPLIEQQRILFQQLKPNILQRANQSFSLWDVSTESVGEAVAAIVLLEQAPFPTILSTVLEKRSTALARIFTAPESQTSSSEQSTKSVIDVTRNAFSVVLSTYTHVCTLFGEDETQPANGRARQSLSHILQDLQRVQTFESFSPASPSVPSHNTPLIPTHHAGTPVLSLLPNVHLLLRYLPTEIVQYVPSLPVDSLASALSPSAISLQLETWFTQCLRTIKSGIENLLQYVSSARQLADVRMTLQTFLAQFAVAPGPAAVAYVGGLSSVLGSALEVRFSQIYTHELDLLVQSLPNILSEHLKNVSTSEEDNDTTQFLFTETIPFPPTSSIFLNALDSEDASDPFQVFKGALQKRLDGRPPVLDFCLCSIERTAEQISADVLAWLSASETAGANINQRAQYLDSAQAALWSLQETLSRTLNNENIDTSQQLIVGDLALHLVKESHVVKTLLLGEKQTSAGFIKALMDVEQQSRKAWLEKAVGNAVEVYRRGVLDSFVVPVLPNASSDKPSSHLQDSLLCLVKAIHGLGALRLQAVPDAIHELLTTFEQRVADSVFTSKVTERLAGAVKRGDRRPLSQAMVDISFLLEIVACGGAPVGKSALQAILAALETLDSTIEYQIATRQHVLRSQLLFAPLMCGSSICSSDSSSSLLVPLGQPVPISALDTKLDMAKPGPRLALLPVHPTVM
ncbi:hypothetical protein EMMF5_006258 [Cystobasidiomycetes sp. EMM_F5]